MQLTYRGVTYEKNIMSLEMKEGEICGKYRGQEITRKYPRHIPQTQPKFDLQYRGVPYSISAMPINTSVQTNDIIAEQNAHNSCPISIRKSLKIENNLTKTHLENIKRNLERRIEIAQSKGDFNLVSLLKEEQLALDW